MSFKIFNVLSGGYLANCYIIRDEESGKAAIVDPGFFSLRLMDALAERGFEAFDYILLTHGHYDHILGASAFKEKTGAKIVIHEKDADFLQRDDLSLATDYPDDYVHPRADLLVKDSSSINLGSTAIKVMHTPGHTEGSVCYLLGETIISGDTLFKNNIGRWDLPTGSEERLLSSLEALYRLEGDYEVLPGHGSETTLDAERKNNPYMRGFAK